MHSPLRILVGLLAVLILGTTVTGVEKNHSWKAGAASIRITPDKFMWMAGYGGRTAPAEGKLTDLWAKALILEDAAGRRAALISLDLVGIDRALSQKICGSLQARYGLERDQIAICTSHTHTGPVVGRNLGPLHYLVLDERQRKLIDEYAEDLDEKVLAVVGRAIKKLAPSRLAWGSGTATFAVNRRNNPARDVPKLRADRALKGPFDHDVPVLAVTDSKQNLSCVVFGYACHCTVLSFLQWSGDYAGFAQIELEKSHPGCVAMFWAGCGADQNPLPRRTVELAQDYGRQLSAAVEDVLSRELSSIPAQLRAEYREIDLPLGELPSRDQIEGNVKSTNKYTSARAKMLLERLEKDGKLAQVYPYPISVWRLGHEVQFVHLGGEVVVDYALRLKSQLAGKRTWVAGYSHDVMAYIPSRRVLREGGYEGAGAMVYYGLPTVWSPKVEDAIVNEVMRLAD